ncbi:MAG: protein kinase [Gemmatimonadetes bacterium]|nr:protein kinase [Gemmatimonadota bacterium]
MTAPERLATALADRYRIERELGAGGMATVYLAEDLKHDRKVAIKVLKSELAAVLGAERFVVEIKTTAALSHPHILPLFDSGTAEGFLFYVMPYIEGETIREKLNRETQLGIGDAVKITREVADALDYAHRHGVIHRDIKPENILLHDGRPMVMDFGIALAVSAAAGGRMTETGLSLGTPHYMSPEQATAEKEITPRSDIYSLATVLYEMLAGEPPHTGGSAQQVVMKIITDTPRSVSELRKSVPQNVASAVATALEKLPADRFDSAKTFADALANPGYTSALTTGIGARASAPRGMRAWVSAAFALVTLLIGYLVGTNGSTDNTGRTVQFYVAMPDSVTPATVCCGRMFALSPDGNTLVFAAGQPGTPALFRLSLDRLGAELIPGTERWASPFFSPNGEWLGFEAAGTLKKMRMAGGPVVPIAETGQVSNATWTEEGDRIVYASTPGGNALWSVNASGGGKPSRVFARDSLGVGRASFMYPEALPGGRAVLSSVPGSRSEGLEGRRIVVVDLETGRVDTLGPGTNASYADGYLFVGGADGTVAAQPFDPATRKTTGEPTTILSGVARRGPVQLQFSVSRGGSLAYDHTGTGFGGLIDYVGLSVADIRAATGSTDELRPGSAPKPMAIEPKPMAAFEPAISPDGRRVVFRAHMTTSGYDLWMLDVRTGMASRFTVGGARSPVWTRSGQRVAYFGPGSGDASSGIYTRAADLSGAPELVLAGSQLSPTSWTPDGRLVFGQISTQQKSDVGVVTPGDTVPQWIVRTDASESHGVVSPDGRWLAYLSDTAVWVQPMAGGGAPVQISAGLAHAPRWGRDGRVLYYVSLPERSIVAAMLAPGVGVTVTRRAPVSVQTAEMVQNGEPNWDLFPDDRRIVFASTGASAVPPKLAVVQNWKALVRAMTGKP